MPAHQVGPLGRDHNPEGFTVWLTGAGVKGGVSCGATNDFRRAVQNIYTFTIHATVRHLLGLDHERLTYDHHSLNRRLTDVPGRVIREVLAHVWDFRFVLSPKAPTRVG
jgi:hypothetical protein